MSALSQRRQYLGRQRCLSVCDVDACARQRGCRRQEQTSLSIWTLSVYVQPAQRSHGQPPRHTEGPMCSVTNEKSNIAAHPRLSNC